MLSLRPNCEACDTDLPPDSQEAMICTYECTFCRPCTENLLSNVCPNCGGGFSPRPIRPQTARREGVGLQYQPASCERVNSPYSPEQMREFARAYAHIAPHQR